MALANRKETFRLFSVGRLSSGRRFPGGESLEGSCRERGCGPSPGALRGNPSGRCGSSPSHRNGFQAVPVFRMVYFTIKPHGGLISKTLMLQVRCAHPTGVFAPKRPFGTFRCFGRLIFRFRTDPPLVRRCSARLIRQAEMLELQPLRGLHQATPCSLIQNAHASGSLREPCGYREPKATPQALRGDERVFREQDR